MLSGGGVNGAWEAGVIHGFAHSEHPEDYYYDVVTGVSAGAINAASMSTFTPEDIVAASAHIIDAWSNLKSSDIYIPMPGGKVIALLEFHSILDSKPALDTFARIYGTGGYKKALTVSAVDANTGERVTMTDK